MNIERIAVCLEQLKPCYHNFVSYIPELLTNAVILVLLVILVLTSGVVPSINRTTGA